MEKLSRKVVLLFAGVLALGAFVMPSLASASSWGAVGSHHVLTSSNIGFLTHTAALGQITSRCTASSFTFRVISTADAQITSGTFGGNCTWSGPGIGDCTVTMALTGLPWTATAVTTSNIQIHGVDIDLTFEQPPAGGCVNFPGQRLRITGTLTGGQWLGNGAGQHGIEFDNDHGLASHSAALGTSQLTVSGTFTDETHSLTLTG